MSDVCEIVFSASAPIWSHTIYIYTFIRHKSRLRKYERKTQRQKYYVQGQAEIDLSMHQKHITEKAIHTSTN